MPTSAVLEWWAPYSEYAGGADEEHFVHASGTSSNYIGAGTNRGILIMGWVVNSTNAGNVQLQWAQNTADASDTKVKAGSWLVAYKMA